MLRKIIYIMTLVVSVLFAHLVFGQLQCFWITLLEHQTRELDLSERFKLIIALALEVGTYLYIV